MKSCTLLVRSHFRCCGEKVQIGGVICGLHGNSRVALTLPSVFDINNLRLVAATYCEVHKDFTLDNVRNGVFVILTTLIGAIQYFQTLLVQF